MSLSTFRFLLCSLPVIGWLAWGTNQRPAPAIAAAEQAVEQVRVLETPPMNSPERATWVALLAEDEGKKSRGSAEAESPDRRPPERDGSRRLPDADGQQRRLVETEVELALRGFQPQTQREVMLYQMIVQLQREMVLLRREVDPMRSGRGEVEREGGMKGRPAAGQERGKLPAEGLGGADAQRDDASQRRAQITRVFHGCDKDGNEVVTFREFVSMREGASEPRARAQTKQLFEAADTDGDEVLSLEEFIAAGEQPASARTREGGEPREGDRPRGLPDGEGRQRGSAGGENPR